MSDVRCFPDDDPEFVATVSKLIGKADLDNGAALSDAISQLRASYPNVRVVRQSGLATTAGAERVVYVYRDGALVSGDVC